MDTVELRRRAAANLAALRNGDVRRAKEAAKLAAARHRVAVKAAMARMREELNDLVDAEEDVRSDSFYSDPATLQGALEEIESQRDKLISRIRKMEQE